MHMYTHAYTYTPAQAYTCIHTCTCMHAYTHLHTYTHMRIHMPEKACTRMHTPTHMHLHTYTCPSLHCLGCLETQAKLQCVPQARLPMERPPIEPLRVQVKTKKAPGAPGHLE